VQPNHVMVELLTILLNNHTFDLFNLKERSDLQLLVQAMYKWLNQSQLAHFFQKHPAKTCSRISICFLRH